MARFGWFLLVDLVASLFAAAVVGLRLKGDVGAAEADVVVYFAGCTAVAMLGPLAPLVLDPFYFIEHGRAGEAAVFLALGGGGLVVVGRSRRWWVLALVAFPWAFFGLFVVLGVAV
ncbi:MAG: hypothetical protein AAFV86_18515 [Pseudomonadota bacterium]